MAHYISNINLRGRLTQIIILVIMILAGVLFSKIAEARNNPRQERPKYRIDKPKYRITVHNHANKVCSILKKKKHAKQRTSLFAGKSSRRKTKAIAETDS